MDLMIRTYNELKLIPTFEERFEYLKLHGMVGEDKFGSLRYLNQTFYTSREWRRLRNSIIVRDNGCDLGVEGYDIFGPIHIHHINPITIDDIKNRSPKLMDPNNLICVSESTHKAITYGDSSFLIYKTIAERKPFDTCPWRKQ